MYNISGYFNQEQDAYTLLTPKTKAEYKTCLMNSHGYGFSVNQYGMGLTQCKCNFRNKNTVSDEKHRTVYFRDDRAGDVWCVGGFPYVSQIENYRCTHYTSYTEIQSEHNGIQVKLRFFVPYDRRADIQTVEVTNLSNTARKISIFPVVFYTLNVRNVMRLPERCFWCADLKRCS